MTIRICPQNGLPAGAAPDSFRQALRDCSGKSARRNRTMTHPPLPQEQQHEIAKRLDAIATALPELGKSLLEIQKGDLDIRSKSAPMDLVTKADFQSEKILKSFISSNFPSDEILAEESGMDHRTRASDITWILDPIDGTINFAHGLPLFAVSIGLAYQRRPVGGLVYLPALGDLYRAIEGKGATKNGNPICVSKNRDFSKSLIVTGFPYSRHKYLTELLASIGNFLEQARGLRRTGTAALDLCWLAEGLFDVHYELHLNPWDTCAGAVILLEAGGRITDFLGHSWDMWQPQLAASNGLVHSEMLECLKPLRGLELQS